MPVKRRKGKKAVVASHTLRVAFDKGDAVLLLAGAAEELGCTEDDFEPVMREEWQRQGRRHLAAGWSGAWARGTFGEPEQCR